MLYLTQLIILLFDTIDNLKNYKNIIAISLAEAERNQYYGQYQEWVGWMTHVPFQSQPPNPEDVSC